MQKKAFTLVELIVVVTVLSILALFAFNSFVVYVKDSRNARRISDVANITRGIDLYRVNLLTYPLPSSSRNIYYGSGVLWKEWYISNDKHFSQILSMWGWSIVDPLTQDYYTYSVSWIWVEYEIATILEDDIRKAMVKWNFNGKIIGQKENDIFSILAIPSIISSDVSINQIYDLVEEEKLVFSQYANLPSTYNMSIASWFPYSPQDYILFTWSLDQLTNSSTVYSIWLWVTQAYSGSTIASLQDYKFYTELNYSQPEAQEFIKILIKQTIWRSDI